MPAPRASLYVRNSKAVTETNLSQEGMEAELRALCDRHGFEVAEVHVDNGLSGAIRHRPEFQRWLADGREGRADVLLTWHVDRLSREGVAILSAIVSVVEGKDADTGKKVHAPVRLMDTKGTDSAVEGWRLPFVVKLEVAHAERERMRDRSRATDRRLRLAGRWPGGPAPYGYRVVQNPDGAGKVLEVVPEERETILRAAALVLSRRPLGPVCRTLTAEGGRPRRAKEWTRTSLAQVLTGEAVLGRLTMDGGQPITDDEGRPIAAFEPILDLPTALALRELLAPKKDPSKRPAKKARLLSGLLSCSSCGATLRVARSGSQTTSYRCPSRAAGRACERPVTVSALPAEEHLATAYLDAVGRFQHAVRRVVASGDAVRRAELDEAIASAGAALVKRATPQGYERLQALQAERDALDAMPATGTREEWVSTGRTVRETWDASDLTTRQSMLGAWYVEVLVQPGRRGVRGVQEDRFGVTTVRDVRDEFPWCDVEDGETVGPFLPGANKPAEVAA